jgi:uncharacterized protein involved in exopolysaccharide biosynthesis
MKPDKIIDAPFISLSSKVSPYFSVDDTEDSNILDLEAQAGDRDEAAMMANDLAQAILEASIKERRDGYATVRKFIETKIDGVSADYDKILAEVEAFKVKEKTVDLDIETQTLINKMVDRIKEKEDLLSTLAEYRAREEVIRKQLQGETPETLSESTMQDNAHIAALKGDLSDLEVGLVGLLKQKTELHPDVQLQRERIRAVEEQLKKEIAALPSSNGDLQDAERLVASTLANIDVLDKQIETFSTQLYSLPGKE